MNRSNLCSLAALCTLLCALPSSAATVAYWTMQGEAGSQAGTVLDISGNQLHGTATKVDVGQTLGQLPQYSNESVGALVYDPVSQTYQQAGSSIRFTNAALPGANNSAAGGQIKVTQASALNLQNFTLEGFVKVNQYVDFSTIVGKVRDGGNPTYNLDLGSATTHALRLRSDHNAQGTAFTNGSPGWNQGFNSTNAGVLTANQWYHVAMTFRAGDAGTSTPGQFQMYLNGVNVTSGTGNLNGGEIYNLIYTSGDLLFGSQAGGRAFDGWMSHFRISDSVLSSNQFLQVVPEPSTTMLAGLAFASVAIRRRR